MMPKEYPAIISSMKSRLLPFVDRLLYDFAIENGQEKQKQNSIRNSNMPIVMKMIVAVFQTFRKVFLR